MRFFDTLHTSWEFAWNSLDVLRNNKLLIIFPILSIIAMGLVSLSMVSVSGGEDGLMTLLDDDTAEKSISKEGYVKLFLFYFFNYFVIIFFNTALIACTMQALQGYEVDLMYGIGVSFKRFPQIVGWAILASLVGVALKALEKEKKLSSIITAVLGMAWAAFTFFAVPFIVAEGSGPITAIKKSSQQILKHWGKAVMCNFSMGFVGFIATLPFLLIIVLLFILAGGMQSTTALITALIAAGVVILLAFAVSSALDIICKTILFCHVTGKTLPENVDRTSLDQAFSAE